ncbi:MFS transporter [Streptomyces sp. NBC_00264]|uniref:MFS transporter n=1 Tax=unclassified Streptomyces TaxID=2593676 RepID=UPI00224DF290|nr:MULTISPECIES: MFS transporter [unclassified Streptomyces]MCX5165531.1 MFS transporter [Streptomyces sp. NBC_00305]MCX5224336.1 MFS transporter [Streptomyces sp. NBC_00264]
MSTPPAHAQIFRDATPASSIPLPGRNVPTIGALIALALVALDLRAPVTAIAPLLGRLRDDLGLSAAAVSVLTALPVLCLGVFAFAGPVLRRRCGESRVVLASLTLLVVGATLRLLPGAAALFVGTALVGAAIGLANVLLPGLIRRRFAGAVAGVTAFYSACLTLGGASGSAVAPPLADATGWAWRGALALVAVPLSIAAILAWWPGARVDARAVDAPTPNCVRLWREAMAWQVTVFFAAQALLAYVVFGWLPTMAQDRGIGEAQSGLLLSLTSLVGVAGAALLPAVYRRLPDQRGPAVLVAMLSGAGLVGVVLAPAPAGVWAAAVVLGLGQGAGFAVALSLIGLRTGNGDETSALSSMAQGTGFLIATIGPLGAGLLHEVSGGWGVPLATLLVVCAIQAAAGLGAGRAGQVRGRSGPRAA